MQDRARRCLRPQRCSSTPILRMTPACEEMLQNSHTLMNQRCCILFNRGRCSHAMVGSIPCNPSLSYLPAPQCNGALERLVMYCTVSAVCYLNCPFVQVRQAPHLHASWSCAGRDESVPIHGGKHIVENSRWFVVHNSHHWYVRRVCNLTTAHPLGRTSSMAQKK